MISVIGLGKAGCNIADKFEEMYPQYKAYKIDVGLKNTKYTKGVKKQTNAEMYEQNFPSMKTFLKNVDKEVLFVTCGSGDISGASLRTLEAIKDRKISVLYIRPDLSLLSPREKMQERVAFNVLQEFARSGVFEKIFLVDNVMAEEIIGSVSLVEYFNTMNELIASTYHMTQVFLNIEPEMSTLDEPDETVRIYTLGLSSLKNSEDKMLFSLKNPTDLIYLYGMTKASLEGDGMLLSKIKNHIKSKIAEFTKVTYAVYSTEYDDDIIYCLAGTKIVQTEEDA